MPDNTITLIGNVTRDPELRYTPSGQANLRLGMAVNRRWQNRQTNEWEEQVSFFDVKCWAQMAENVSESLGRGTRVVVSGRLEQRSWETDNGDKRSKVEVVADAQRRLGPISSAATSTTVRFSPSWVSHERCSSRPVTMTRMPLLSDSAAFSAISRHTTMLKNETFSSHSLVWRFCQRRLTARPNVATA